MRKHWLGKGSHIFSYGKQEDLSLLNRITDGLERKITTVNVKDFFRAPFLISYISQFMTLLPGDIISTGTPEGVGMGQHPQLYLKPGDQVRLGIEGLGEQCQTAIAYAN